MTVHIIDQFKIVNVHVETMDMRARRQHMPDLMKPSPVDRASQIVCILFTFCPINQVVK